MTLFVTERWFWLSFSPLDLVQLLENEMCVKLEVGFLVLVMKNINQIIAEHTINEEVEVLLDVFCSRMYHIERKFGGGKLW